MNRIKYLGIIFCIDLGSKSCYDFLSNFITTSMSLPDAYLFSITK